MVIHTEHSTAYSQILIDSGLDTGAESLTLSGAMAQRFLTAQRAVNGSSGDSDSEEEPSPLVRDAPPPKQKRNLQLEVARPPVRQA